jgi:hypothetical protein
MVDLVFLDLHNFLQVEIEKGKKNPGEKGETNRMKNGGKKSTVNNPNAGQLNP